MLQITNWTNYRVHAAEAATVQEAATVWQPLNGSEEDEKR